MNLRDLHYIVTLAEENHFGRAAKKCHVSQPALSGQIRKLEAFLGVVLFERTNKSVQITPIGEQIVAQARQILTLADEIIATAQATHNPFSGHFRLGMISTIGPYLSPLILPAIRRKLPDVSLTLVEDLTINLEHRILTGELDAAILATAPADPHLQAVPLYDEPFWIALPNSHPLAKQTAVDLTQLPHEQLLLLTDGHCLRDQVLDLCHAAAETNHANTRETSLETLLALIAAGGGVTLAPALTRSGNNSTRAGIVMRREASGSAGRLVRLVCRTSFPRSQLIARLASIICTNVPKTMVRILNPEGNPPNNSHSKAHKPRPSTRG